MTVEVESAVLRSVSVSPEIGRPVPDAATREIIGYAPVHTVDDLDAAVTAARAAQPGWAAAGHTERGAALARIADEIEAHAAELAVLLSREQGKPLDGLNARFEIGGAAAWTRSAAELPLDPEVVFEDENSRSEVHHVPLGVVGGIGPWNWPVLIAVWQIAPALRMGNTVVIKPSEYTPLSVLALAELYNLHLPPGVLSVVCGGGDVGAAVAAHADIDKVMFTGSTATGRKIVAASASNLARLTLELGGNDPGIVLPGADVEAIAAGLFWGIFLNTGQTCAALKRLYVHESLYDEVVDALAALVESTPMGNGLETGNLLGPVQNQRQFEIVERLVEDARARGARVVTGGSPAPELGPLFYRATIVADIADGFALVDEEQFGPAIPVIKYQEVADAIRLANSSPLGLGASVWGDRDEALPVARQLEAGTVWINQHGTLNPQVPFGGTKGSGYGMEFGVEGLKAVAAARVITY